MTTSVPPGSERSAALASLLARVALGDRQALAALYQATSAHLFGVIVRINPDRAQAEEILQDVYVAVWRATHGYDAARAQPLTWLVAIARHGAIDSLRRRRTAPVTLSATLPGEDGEDDVDRLAAFPSASPGPLELLQQAAQSHHVERCVEQLSADQRQCVALAYYQGLSHGEIARHLAQPLGTVKSWVRRALLALKDCLAGARGTA